MNEEKEQSRSEKDDKTHKKDYRKIECHQTGFPKTYS